MAKETKNREAQSEETAKMKTRNVAYRILRKARKEVSWTSMCTDPSIQLNLKHRNTQGLARVGKQPTQGLRLIYVQWLKRT
jgi:hypothetical protein